MKKLCLFVLILLLGSLFAQSGYVYTQELNSDYASRSIYICSDNSVVVLGNSDNTEEFHVYNLVITKLDPFGNLLWRRNLGTGDMISITGVDIDANDTITFITTIIGGTFIQLWTIDSTGIINTLSTPVQIPIMAITFNKALRTLNNEIVAVGTAFYNYDVSSACFFRFSATGDTVSTAFWPADLSSLYHKARAYDIAQKDNGNLLVTCMLHTNIGSVLEINICGVELNRINIPDSFADFYSSIALCRIYNDETYYIAGLFGSTNVMAKVFSLSGTDINSQFDIDDSVVFNVWSMLLNQNGVFICGSINGSLAYFTLSGELTWVWHAQGNNICEYISEGFGSPSSALLAIDITGCIYWAWSNGGNQVITKLLPSGQLPVEEILSSPEAIMYIYPNPMNDHVRICVEKSTTSSNGNYVDIFNIKGQKLCSLQLINSVTEWNGRDNLGRQCDQGIYLIRYSNNISKLKKICFKFLEDK
jgi:hypothetical protein